MENNASPPYGSYDCVHCALPLSGHSPDSFDGTPYCPSGATGNALTITAYTAPSDTVIPAPGTYPTPGGGPGAATPTPDPVRGFWDQTMLEVLTEDLRVAHIAGTDVASMAQYLIDLGWAK